MKKKSQARQRTASSKRWLQEHESDEFVQKARKLGYRSRARFKLEEIDARDHLLKAGLTVVDLGAAPGGWAEYAAQRVGPKGTVIALDILPMEAIPGVISLQADFTELPALDMLASAIGSGNRVDLVISDMAPNISGISVSDQPKSMYLAELALEFATQTLKPGGSFLTKVFQGEGFDSYLKQLRQTFKVVASRKPRASRARSREMYLLAQGYSPADEQSA